MKRETIAAVAYLRVSTKGQIDKTGFDRQIDTIQKFCKANDFEIMKIYKEQVSGIKDEEQREIFMSMINDCLSNEYKFIICESLDRLAREYRIQEQLLIFLASKGLHFISANTGEDITEAFKGDNVKILMIQILGCISQFERSQIISRLKKGREKKRQETGKCGGPPKFGDDPEEKDLLKRIIYMRRRSSGQKQPMSFQKIANQLNAQGYCTKTGKPWEWWTVSHVLRGKKNPQKTMEKARLTNA